MAAKFGLGEEDRCVLGYHAYRRSSAAIYSRDLHAAPLRRLERMIACVRSGTFMPDASRSGTVVSSTAKPSTLSKSDHNKGVAFGIVEEESHLGDFGESPEDHELSRPLKEAIPPEEKESMEACLTSQDDPWLNPESRDYEPFHESLRIEIRDNPPQTDFDRDSEDEAAFKRQIERVPPTDDSNEDIGSEDTSESKSSWKCFQPGV